MSRIFTLFTLVWLCSMVADATPNPNNTQQPQLNNQWAFRENIGQVTDQFGNLRSDIQFQLYSSNTSVFIGRGNLHYQWNHIEKQGTPIADSIKSAPAISNVNSYRMDVALVGCNQEATIIKESIHPDFDIFYAQGLDGATAYSYQKITYQNIYPNIDWVLYVKDNTLKYDFIVHPSGKVSDIQIRYDGANDIAIKDGTVVAVTPMGSITEERPYSYNQADGNKIPSRFVLNRNVLGFEVDSYEGTLVIDPELRLEWATYYGGIAPEPADMGVNSGDWVSGNNAMVATDGDGNVYVTGTTMSSENIATIGSYQSTRNNASNVFLVKFNSQGQRIWSTYYGGSSANYALSTHAGSGHAVACDTLGNVYLTGCTWNIDGIATPGSYQSIKGGVGAPVGSWYWPDLFLVKFDGEGTRQWATYYGGTQAEGGGSIAVTPDGSNIYLAGTTDAGGQTNYNVVSPDAIIPYSGTTTNMPQAGFIARFDASGQRIWGTYINPTTKGYTIVMDMAIDPQGYIYLSGSSHADPGSFYPADTSIVTWGSFQQYNNSPYTYGRDAFLQKWDSNGNRLWGTFYGGGGALDLGCAITCDDTGNVYMTGSTNSDFGPSHGIWCIATPGSFRETLYDDNIGGGAFLVKFNGLGERQWGTYFNASKGNALAAVSGKLYMTGTVSNDSLATPCAHQENHGETNADDGFLAQFNDAGYPQYVTYYGGEASDGGTSIAISTIQDRHSIYLAGGTKSHQRIATPGSHKDVLIGNEYDVFLAKFYTPHVQEIISCFKEDSILISAIDTSGVNYQWNNNATGHSLWVKASGSYTVRYEKEPGCLTIDSFLVHIYPLPALVTIKNCPGKGEAIAMTNVTNNNLYTYSWYSASGNLLQSNESGYGDTLSGLEAGNYTLQIQTAIGCDTHVNFTIEAFPAVALTVSTDTVITARSSALLWASGADHYSWVPDRWLDNAFVPTPVSSPQDSITYTVTGINQYGCSASKNVHIDIMKNLLIPNAFSPNGDGINDEFKIVNYGYQRLLEFRIFNRWGAQVFSTLDPDKGWDGSYNSKLADLGIYSYYIRLRDGSSQEQVYKGSLTLVR